MSTFNQLKKNLAQLKKIKLVLRSGTYLAIVVTLSLLPMALVIFAWLYTWVTGNRDVWLIQMQDQLLKIIDHIMAPAVVAGVVAYGAKLVDQDNDGVPDDYQKGSDKNENSNVR